jgi:SAM-dependent methyltransferase
MDARTEELRDAHDVLSEWYAKNLVGVLESMPVERAMLDLFAEMTLAVGADVADVGCGTGRLLPYLASRGLSPRGVDLSPRMVEVAQRDNPGFAYEVADLRELPFEDESLAGVVCWFSLIFLAPDARARAFAELGRVVRPGGHLVAAFKDGDGTVHRNGPGSRVGSLGIDFDRYWLSAREMENRFAAAGFALVFHGSTPPEEAEPAYGYMLVRKTDPRLQERDNA